MFDIITFGSSTEDTFLRLKKEHSHTLKRESASAVHDLCVCVPFGSKILVDSLEKHSGGGGANTACALSNLGFKVAYMGKVGDDDDGKEVSRALKRFKANTSLMKKSKSAKTAVSVILSPADGERTILVYRGACHFLEKNEIDWQKIKKANWFYIAPLYKKTAQLFADLIKFAKENKIKVAVNLSKEQIGQGKDKLKPVLNQVDILFLNREEALSLTGTVRQTDDQPLIEQLSALCKGIIVITKGSDGSLVFTGKNIYQAGIAPSPVVEKTGAGDAFASGFLAGLLLKDNIEYAIQLATANAAGCIQKIGAKNGLLSKKDLSSLPKVEISKK